MFATLATFHLLMSALNVGLFENSKAKFDTTAVFQPAMSPYVVVAVAGLFTHAVTAAWMLLSVMAADDGGRAGTAEFAVGAGLGVEVGTRVGVAVGAGEGVEVGAGEGLHAQTTCFYVGRSRARSIPLVAIADGRQSRRECGPASAQSQLGPGADVYSTV
jgi:hypothetical protein